MHSVWVKVMHSQPRRVVSMYFRFGFIARVALLMAPSSYSGKYSLNPGDVTDVVMNSTATGASAPAGTRSPAIDVCRSPLITTGFVAFSCSLSNSRSRAAKYPSQVSSSNGRFFLLIVML